MKYPTIFHLIYQVFNKGAVSDILIGGFAVNYYNVTRQTAEIDFLITKEDFEKAVILLKKEGYKETYSHENFARLNGSHLYLMDIDFMFVDKETIDKIMKDGEEISIAGQKFTVAPDLDGHGFPALGTGLAGQRDRLLHLLNELGGIVQQGQEDLLCHRSIGEGTVMGRWGEPQLPGQFHLVLRRQIQYKSSCLFDEVMRYDMFRNTHGQ